MRASIFRNQPWVHKKKQNLGLTDLHLARTLKYVEYYSGVKHQHSNKEESMKLFNEHIKGSFCRLAVALTVRPIQLSGYLMDSKPGGRATH